MNNLITIERTVEKVSSRAALGSHEIRQSHLKMSGMLVSLLGV